MKNATFGRAAGRVAAEGNPTLATEATRPETSEPQSQQWVATSVTWSRYRRIDFDCHVILNGRTAGFLTEWERK